MRAKRKPYLPYPDLERASWLNNFASKLPGYALKYHIPVDEVEQMQADNLWFHQFVDYRNAFITFSQSLTTYRNLVTNGQGPLGPITIPAPPLPVTIPEPGLFFRVSSIVARIKASRNYIASDGEDLGIIGTEGTVDEYKMQPQLVIRMAQASYPEVVWQKDGMSALEIHVKNEAGKWVLLAVDIEPNYMDKRPLPPAGQAEVRYYKAIYRLHDERIGQWSNEVKFTVVGE